MNRAKAFTLIELLIVVAIIAILAAIAVPNFLEAQVRSKVTRMKSDMRSAAVAIETYRVDHNKYPFDGSNGQPSPGPLAPYNYWFLPFHLSTPISYISSSQVVDVFRKPGGTTAHWQWTDVRYRNIGSSWGTEFKRTTPSTWLSAMTQDFGGWVMTSVGPDFQYGPSGSSSTTVFPGPAPTSWLTGSGYPDHTQPYDPTNGTVSYGDIHRSQVSPNGYSNTP